MPEQSAVKAPANDRERLLAIAKQYGSVKKIPADQIRSSSADRATVITVDGTKVTDALLKQAIEEDKARTAANAAASAIPDGVSREEVQAMIEAAVLKALGK